MNAIHSMFTPDSLLLFAHLLLFVYWLGSDVAVFHGVRFVLDPRLSLETRKTVMALVHWVDALPRICLVLTVPVGLSLALRMGVLQAPPAAQPVLLALAWIGGVAWLVLVLRIYKGATGVATKVDWVVRTAVMLAFLAAGLASLAGHGPVMEGANWLAVKFVLFGAIIACGVALRILGRPFGAALAEILAGRSTPELEATLRGAMKRSKRVVIVLWILVALTAYVGLTKSV